MQFFSDFVVCVFLNRSSEDFFCNSLRMRIFLHEENEKKYVTEGKEEMK